MELIGKELYLINKYINNQKKAPSEKKYRTSVGVTGILVGAIAFPAIFLSTTPSDKEPMLSNKAIFLVSTCLSACYCVFINCITVARKVERMDKRLNKLKARGAPDCPNSEKQLLTLLRNRIDNLVQAKGKIAFLNSQVLWAILGYSTHRTSLKTLIVWTTLSTFFTPFAIRELYTQVNSQNKKK